MRTGKISLGLLLGVCLLSWTCAAQSYWILSYQGTQTSGEPGKLKTDKVTESNFIQQCATNSGVSVNNLVFVLHINANDVGDALEVVNQNDPNLFRCEVCKLAFQESYTNSSGNVKSFAYIYNETSGHSRGSAIFTRQTTGGGAVTNTTSISGTMQFWLGTWDDNAPDPNAVVCTGTFTSKAPLKLP